MSFETREMFVLFLLTSSHDSSMSEWFACHVSYDMMPNMSNEHDVASIVSFILERRGGGVLYPPQRSRVSRAWASSMAVWQNDEQAYSFLTQPHALLEGRRPAEVALTDEGVTLVEDILGRLTHGSVA